MNTCEEFWPDTRKIIDDFVLGKIYHCFWCGRKEKDHIGMS